MRVKSKSNPFEGRVSINSDSGFQVNRASQSDGYSGGGLVINRGDLESQIENLKMKAMIQYGYMDEPEPEVVDEETEQKLQFADSIINKFGSLDNFLDKIAKLDQSTESIPNNTENNEQLNINEIKKSVKTTIKTDDDLINNILLEL